MAVTQTMIDAANASIAATWPAYTKYVHADNYVCTVTVPNGTGAAAPVPVTVNVDGTTNTSSSTPQSQVWEFTDIYTNSAGDTGIQAQVKFTKNNVKVLGITANIATQVVTNQTRPGLPRVFIYEPQSSMQVSVLPIATATATATNTFYLDLTIFDSSFG